MLTRRTPETLASGMFSPTKMSQATPSYLYSGLDSETRELQADLESLGGGNSRSANLGLHIIIDDIRGRRKSKILWQLDNFVGLRDPQMGDAAASTSMNYFSATSCHTVSELLSSSSSNVGNATRVKAIHEDLADWVLSGFNACLIGYGVRGSGKTLTLFGPKEHSSRFPKSLIRKTLEYLYAATAECDAIIGLSCWALKRNSIIDLCDDKDKSSGSHQTPRSANKLAIIECRDIKTALKVLHTSRARCVGAEAVESSQYLSDSERSHFFCRVTLFQPNSGGEPLRPGSRMGLVSHIHFVDLIGTTSIEERNFEKLSELDRECRREVALQHAAFIRVLQQMRTVSNKAVSETGVISKSPLQITSARDSKLTMMLAPLIQGNVKTSILLFMKDEESQYKHCKSALSSMKDINEIVSACYIPSQRVDKLSLEMRHPDRVLTPRPHYYGSIQKHWNDHAQPDTFRLSGAPLIELLDFQESTFDQRFHGYGAETVSPKEKVTSGYRTDDTNPNTDRVMDEFHELMESIQTTFGEDIALSTGGRLSAHRTENESVYSQDSTENCENDGKKSSFPPTEEPTLLSLAAEPMEVRIKL